MASQAPQATSTTLTLRLKHHKATTILHAPPTQPFSALKAELLRALHQTHPAGCIPSAAGSVAIPRDAGDVLFARPRDPFDAGAGWVVLATTAEEAVEAAGGGLGFDVAGEVGVGGRKGRGGDGHGHGLVVCASPKEAGLKDGAVLAFRFKGQGGGRRAEGGGGGGGDGDVDVDEGVDVDEEDDGDDDSEGMRGGVDAGWDVVLPSYEDSTGVVNEGDVGAVRNYTG